jgi:hypothetical protein
MRPICPFSGAASKRFFEQDNVGGKTFERRFDPCPELVVHGRLFAAPVGGAAQDCG